VLFIEKRNVLFDCLRAGGAMLYMRYIRNCASSIEKEEEEEEEFTHQH
jgi:hypothetical protein